MAQLGKPAVAGQPEAMQGFFMALAAYLIWGMQPLFLKYVSHIPALEVLSNRIVWSIPVAGVILLVLGRTSDVRAALRSPRTLLMAAVTASLISFNWGLYVWAIAVERAVETAFGYYINPLVNVLIGAVLLGERFSRAQMVAIGLAAVAVLILTLTGPGLPWLSLALAMSFVTYGYLRKTLPIGPSQGFFLEVLIVGIPASLYLVWLLVSGDSHYTDAAESGDLWLLMLAGPITAIPLILYAFGAKLLRYSTLGLMQYLAPTCIFLLAVLVFDEPFTRPQQVAFSLIWIALVIYSWSTYINRNA